MRLLAVGGLLAVMASVAPATPITHTLNAILDYGNSDGGSNAWSYVCERQAYQAWFGFDTSTISDGAVVQSIEFSVKSSWSNGAWRTLWYEPVDSWIANNTNPGNKALSELVGAAWHDDATDWLTISANIASHDWQADLVDDRISLMLTGPENGDHTCGVVHLMESQAYVAQLRVTVEDIPEPATLALLGMGALALLRRRRSR